jgi:uncharacterized protein
MPTKAVHSVQGPRSYLNPYLGGTLLGIVLFLAFFITGGGLGASAAFSRVQIGVLDWFAPSHIDRVAYFAEVAGGSRSAWVHYSVFMLAGTFLGGTLSCVLNRRFKIEVRKGPRVSVALRLTMAFLGGAIMAYGARLARGCTSGQALSGGAVLSVGSWAFMFSVFAGGYAVAWLLRRLWT